MDTVTEIVNPILQFKDIAKLNNATMGFIIRDLEVTNEEPIIGDTDSRTVEEIKRRAKDTYARQNRAVTKQDYISTVYSMPVKFGAVKRCNILRDHNSLKRNLNCT